MDGTRTNECDDDRNDVDSELELKELGDRIVDVAAPHNRFNDRSEIVVREDNVGCLLGDVRTRNSLKNTVDVISPWEMIRGVIEFPNVTANYASYHSEADVRLLQRRTIIGTVASDSDHLTVLRNRALDNALHERVLVGRLRTCQHAQLRPDLVELGLAELAVLVANARVELLALERKKVLAGPKDTAGSGNRAGSVDIVAGDHANGDTGTLALDNCVRHF